MDPWKHRSAGMQCKTCMWFAEKVRDRIGSADSDTNPVMTVGRCRRHAPTMNGYPVVYVSDWCGDHKLNENAV